MRSRTALAFVVVLVASFSLLSLYCFVNVDRQLSFPIKFHEESADSSTLTSESSATGSLNTSCSPILLVSALFPLAKAKHSMDDYRSWLTQFLGGVETPVYFFAPPELADLVRSVRPAHLPLFLNTSFTSAWDAPPLRRPGMREKYEAMHKKDREAFRHSPGLYAVWNAKPFFLEEGMRNANAALHARGLQKGVDVEDYRKAFWVDAGSFRREHDYAKWPGCERVERVFTKGAQLAGERKDNLVLFPIQRRPRFWWRFWRETKGPIDVDFSEGSFFGGSLRAIAWYAETFYAQHDRYIDMGYFVGKDQTLINAIIFLHARRFITVSTDDDQPLTLFPSRERSNCQSGWYYYQYWLASAAERLQMSKRWRNELNAKAADVDGVWWTFGWLTGSINFGRRAHEGKNQLRSEDVTRSDLELCPVKPVLSIAELLRAQFGFRWWPKAR